VTTAVATIAAILLSQMFGHYDTIFQGLNKMISYVSPPITTVFILGVFWRKATSRAAYLTLIVGAILGAAAFVLDWNKVHWFQVMFREFMLVPFVLFVICVVVMMAGSLAWPEPLKKEAETLIWTSWREPLRRTATGRGLADYRVLSAVVLGIFVVLYVVFR